ncbi:MAG: hypothetical protein ACREXR_02355 [Gammaproteobacteria bacterium]
MVNYGFVTALTNQLARRYGLKRQFDETELEDVSQQALLRLLEAKAAGKNEKVAAYRGAHEHIRFLVYGNSRVRTNPVKNVEYTDQAHNGRAVEELTEAIRIMDKFPINSDAYNYYNNDMTLKEIGKLRGVSEARVCQTLAIQMAHAVGICKG